MSQPKVRGSELTLLIEHIESFLNLASSSLILCSSRSLESSLVNGPRLFNFAQPRQDSAEMIIGRNVVRIARNDLSKLTRSFYPVIGLLKLESERVSRE